MSLLYSSKWKLSGCPRPGLSTGLGSAPVLKHPRYFRYSSASEGSGHSLFCFLLIPSPLKSLCPKILRLLNLLIYFCHNLGHYIFQRIEKSEANLKTTDNEQAWLKDMCRRMSVPEYPVTTAAVECWGCRRTPWEPSGQLVSILGKNDAPKVRPAAASCYIWGCWTILKFFVIFKEVC